MKRFVGRKHKGDTLVEVTLAIGIFSMVAVAAVSVINISTTGAQSSLESTITREEIDGQAEALRFIQSAYIAGGEIDESAPTKYAKLWQMITDHAIDISGLSGDDSDAILQYNPIACDKLYQKDSTAWDSLNMQKAFIINTHAMNSDNLNDIIVDYKNNNTKFGFAQTFPRLIYGNSNSDALYDPTINNATLHKAEGIYIIAVRDADGTIVVEDSNGNISVKSAYIDFYIRSCWFTPNATRASTISTAIRLYDPDKVSINKYERQGIIVKYEKGADDATGTMPSQYVFTGKTVNLLQNTFSRPGYKFIGWKEKKSDGTIASAYSSQYTAPSNITEGQSVTFVAMWQRLFTLTYYNTNGSILCSEEFLSNGSDNHTFIINGCHNADGTRKEPTKEDSRMEFLGWSASPDGSKPRYDISGGVKNTESSITAQNGIYNLSLYPVWREVNTFAQWDSNVANDTSETGCLVFNIQQPSSGTLGIDYTSIQKGNIDRTLRGLYRSYYNKGQVKAPMDGYIVKGGKHVEILDNVPGYGSVVNLQGYCVPAANNIGVHYTVKAGDTFELSADMDKSGILTHPTGGYMTVAIGTLQIRLQSNQYASGCGSVGGYVSYPDPEPDPITGEKDHDKVHIELNKNGNKYDASVNGKKIVECTNSSNSDVDVRYLMYHGSHACDSVYSAQLFNIEMWQVTED